MESYLSYLKWMLLFYLSGVMSISMLIYIGTINLSIGILSLMFFSLLLPLVFLLFLRRQIPEPEEYEYSGDLPHFPENVYQSKNRSEKEWSENENTRNTQETPSKDLDREKVTGDFDPTGFEVENSKEILPKALREDKFFSNGIRDDTLIEDVEDPDFTQLPGSSSEDISESRDQETESSNNEEDEAAQKTGLETEDKDSEPDTSTENSLGEIDDKESIDGLLEDVEGFGE